MLKHHATWLLMHCADVNLKGSYVGHQKGKDFLMNHLK